MHIVLYFILYFILYLSTNVLLYVLSVLLVQRSEALQAALAKRLTASQDPDMPAPFKRQSLMRRKPVENGTQPQLHGGIVELENPELLNF